MRVCRPTFDTQVFDRIPIYESLQSLLDFNTMIKLPNPWLSVSFDTGKDARLPAIKIGPLVALVRFHLAYLAMELLMRR